MGEIDKKTKEYLSHKDVFADLFNYVIYDGSQVIKPDDLSELDPVDIVGIGDPKGDETDFMMYSGPAAKRTGKTVRDIAGLWCAKRDDSAAYLIFGIVNQRNVHYAIPVRCAVYDSMNYAGQVRNTAWSNRQLRLDKKITVTGDEFISGFRKKDRLTPVITLTVYFGADKWDGPRSLHEMLGPVPDAESLAYINDYKLNLIAPAEMPAGAFKKFKTDLGVILEFIKYSKDKKMFRELAATDRANAMDSESVRLTNLLTGSKLQFSDKGGKITMCKAIDDIMADSRAEGKAEGIAVGKAEGKSEGRESALRDSIRSVMGSLHVSITQAMDILSIPEAERNKFL